MTEDFLARENEFLGGAFSPSAGGPLSTNTDNIDLDRAASAFPDIDLDGGIPSIPQQTTSNNDNSFGFDLNSLTSPPAPKDVKVTGDDEIDKFESAFPDIAPMPEVTTAFNIFMIAWLTLMPADLLPASSTAECAF
jgi:hypothetical protein